MLFIDVQKSLLRKAVEVLFAKGRQDAPMPYIWIFEEQKKCGM